MIFFLFYCNIYRYVHMDVQATNILFVTRQSWQLKLADFSSAQKIGPIMVKPVRPNVYWIAPELLRDDKESNVSPQCDVWGLGVITFCL